MRITRNKIAALIILVIVLALFNVVAFVASFTRAETFWTGYAFGTFALLFSAGVALYALGRDGLKSKFYGFPLAYLAWIYLIVQMILSLVCMAVPSIPAWIAILASAVVLALALIGLVSVDMGREAVEKIDQKVAEKVFYVKSLQVDVEMLAEKTADPALAKSLKTLAEAIRYSDPMSSEKLAVLENTIEIRITQLSQAIETGDAGTAGALIEETQLLLIERNRKCKLLKGV